MDNLCLNGCDLALTKTMDGKPALYFVQTPELIHQIRRNDIRNGKVFPPDMPLDIKFFLNNGQKALCFFDAQETITQIELFGKVFSISHPQILTFRKGLKSQFKAFVEAHIRDKDDSPQKSLARDILDSFAKGKIHEQFIDRRFVDVNDRKAILPSKSFLLLIRTIP